jgi:hypothetical protein
MGRTRAALLVGVVIASMVAIWPTEDREVGPDARSIARVDGTAPASSAPAPRVVAAPPAAATTPPATRESVSGRVTFPDGTPVPGIEVSAAYGRRTTTDAEGRFTFEDVRGPRTAVRLPLAAVEASARPGDTNVDFVFPWHVVRLRATSDAGEPIPTARCETSARCSCGPGGHGSASSSSIDSLVFAVPTGCATGYLLRASGFAAATGSARFEGSPRTHEVLVTMERAKPPGALALRVTDADGAPVTTAHVSCEDTRGYGRRWDIDDLLRKFTFDSDGRIEFRRVPSGPYRFDVGPSPAANGRERALVPVTLEVEIRPDAVSAFDVVLRPGGRISVTMLDASGDAAIPDAVRLEDAGGREVRDALERTEPHAEEGEGPAPESANPWVTRTPLLPGEYVVHASFGAPGSPGHRTTKLPVRIEPFVVTRAELRFPR